MSDLQTLMYEIEVRTQNREIKTLYLLQFIVLIVHISRTSTTVVLESLCRKTRCIVVLFPYYEIAKSKISFSSLNHVSHFVVFNATFPTF